MTTPHHVALLFALVSSLLGVDALEAQDPSTALEATKDSLDGLDRYGPWQLGMSRAEVEAFVEHGPYQPVSTTGGLETPNGRFEGRTVNVSFVFDPQDRLDVIQVWPYEGASADDAYQAWFEVYRRLVTRHGETKLDGRVVASDLETPAALAALLPETFSAPHEVMNLDEVPKAQEFQIHPIRIALTPAAPEVAVRTYALLVRIPELGRFGVYYFVQMPRF